MFPATRMTNRSPKPWSKTISTGTRESEHPRIAANGFWPAASSLRSAWLGCVAPLRTSDAKRRFPSRSRSSAARAGIMDDPVLSRRRPADEEAGCPAASPACHPANQRRPRAPRSKSPVFPQEHDRLNTLYDSWENSAARPTVHRMTCDLPSPCDWIRIRKNAPRRMSPGWAEASFFSFLFRKTGVWSGVFPKGGTE